MEEFIFHNPTKIIFGRGKIGELGKEIRPLGKRVLLVYGQGSIRKYGVYDQIVRSLEDGGIERVELPGVRPNPVLSLVYRGIERAREAGVDAVVAAGGGSAMDTAKAIAAGVAADHDVWEFFQFRKTVQKALPVFAVPTVAASASEMNGAAVITREEGARKFSARSPHLNPRTSILDPSVLFSLSPTYSAYSAVDAITHALEGYFNNTAGESALQERLIEALIRTIMESTEIILRDPRNYDARASMMWSAVLAFNGLTTAGLGRATLPVHMMEHSLSALYDIPHGAGLSILLPAWMAFRAAGDPGKFARFGRAIFGIEDRDDLSAALRGARFLRAWFGGIGAPVTLQEGGIPEGDVETIAEHALALAGVWQLPEYTKDVMIEVLRRCTIPFPG
jgi:alcohol dehydrogenase YqhD (iron-dependent ADH family)